MNEFDKFHYYLDENHCGFCFDPNSLTLFKINSTINDLTQISKMINERRITQAEHLYKLNPESCSTLTFILTNKCNLRCTYCYWNDVKFISKDSLSSELILKYFVMFDNLFQKGIETVQFFGGEPLLEIKTIKESVELIEQFCKINNRPSPYFGINTNGTLLNNDVVDFLYEHNFTLTISIDGKKENNTNRVKLDGSMVYEEVALKIFDILRRYPDFCISAEMTYTSNNIENFIKTKEHDISSLYDLGIKGVHMVPVITDKDNSQSIFGSKCTKNDLYSYIKYAYDFMFSKLNSERPFYIDDYLYIASLLNEKKQRNAFCDAGITRFAIDSKGKCYPCHMFSVRDAKQIEFTNLTYRSQKQAFLKQVKNQLLSVSKDNYEMCNKCWCKYLCRKCICTDIDEDYCQFTRFKTEYMLYCISKI